jgi:hydrogenase maturation protease
VRRRALVAGIGNVFFGDDGFGVEVATRLSQERLPGDVHVMDAGIRARDLAYELLEGGYQTAILVDAVARGGRPGTLYVIDPAASDGPAPAVAAFDGHSMTPETTLAFVHALGGTAARIVIVGCEPERIDEGMGLSPPVTAAVDEALSLVRELLCA